MRLLDRYILRELLHPLAYCLVGFLIFYVSFDLIFRINEFQGAHLLFKDILKYYAVTLPEILADQVLPVSLLLASLYALTTHSRYNELTAMRAAGVGLWRLAVPYLGVGLVCGVVILALNELWAPRASEAAKAIMESRKPGEHDRNWISRLEFHNDFDQRHWNMTRYNRVTSEMINPNITWEDPDHSSHLLSAQRGIYTNDTWRFFGVERWDRAPGESYPTQSTNEVSDVPFSETPASIRTEIKVNTTNPAEAVKAPQLSIRELLTYLHWHPHLNRKERWPSIMTQLQSRIAAPFTCLAVILIALPFGVRTGRHNVFVGVAGSIFICFAYFILQRITVGLGIANYLPPIVAAWLPNVLFAVTGIVLVSRVR